MTIRGFLEDQREAARGELRGAAGNLGRVGAINGRISLIDWLLDGADELTPDQFVQALSDAAAGRRPVPGMLHPAQASDLLQRWEALVQG